MTHGKARTRVILRARRRGFTLVEVMFSLIVLLMMTFVFAACFPLADRQATYASNYAQATFLAQHKIDELRTAGYDQLNYSSLISEGVIDAAPTTSPYSFTSTDNLTSFFPNGSTGTITVVADPNAPAGTEDDVTVTVTWVNGGVSTGSYSTSAIIIAMIHR